MVERRHRSCPLDDVCCWTAWRTAVWKRPPTPNLCGTNDARNVWSGICAAVCLNDVCTQLCRRNSNALAAESLLMSACKREIVSIGCAPPCGHEGFGRSFRRGCVQVMAGTINNQSGTVDKLQNVREIIINYDIRWCDLKKKRKGALDQMVQVCGKAKVAHGWSGALNDVWRSWFKKKISGLLQKCLLKYGFIDVAESREETLSCHQDRKPYSRL